MDELIATAIAAIVVAFIGGIIGLISHSLINDYLKKLKKSNGRERKTYRNRKCDKDLFI